MKFDILEQKQMFSRLYVSFFIPVLKQFSMTQMEMDILLFLANNPEYDTAADLVRIRCLTKSHVSVSVEKLVSRGFLERVYLSGNRKTIHLKLREEARDAVEAGRACQRRFFSRLFEGMTQEEVALLQRLLDKAGRNMKRACEEAEGKEG